MIGKKLRPIKAAVAISLCAVDLFAVKAPAVTFILLITLQSR